MVETQRAYADSIEERASALVEAIDAQQMRRIARVQEHVRTQEPPIDVLVVTHTDEMISEDYGYLGVGEDEDVGRSLTKNGVLIITPNAVERISAPSDGQTGFHHQLTRKLERVASKGAHVVVEGAVIGSVYEAVREAAAKAHLGAVERKGVLAGLRREKTPEEIDLMDVGQTELERVMREVIPTLMYDGMTERELAQKIEALITKNGAWEVSFPAIVAFGENGAKPHHRSGDTQLRPGTPILIDCGNIFMDRVCTDMTRNYWYGPQEGALWEEYTADYDRLKIAQEKVAQRYVVGASVKEVDASVRGELGGIPHGNGHGLAQRSVHASPSVSPRGGAATFVEGDVVSNEPGIYKDGKYGIRIEDVIAITKDGPRIFANHDGARALVAVATREREEQDASAVRTERAVPADVIRANLTRIAQKMEREDLDMYVAAKTEDATSTAVKDIVGFLGTNGYMVFVRSAEAKHGEGGIESYFVTDGRYASGLATWGESIGLTDCFVIEPDEEKDGKVIEKQPLDVIMKLLARRAAVERSGGRHVKDGFAVAVEGGAMADIEDMIAVAITNAGEQQTPFSRVRFAALPRSEDIDEAAHDAGSGASSDSSVAYMDHDSDGPAHFVDPDTHE